MLHAEAIRRAAVRLAECTADEQALDEMQRAILEYRVGGVKLSWRALVSEAKAALGDALSEPSGAAEERADEPQPDVISIDDWRDR